MKADYDALVAMGFAPLAVSEMAMMIALGCYYNRIGILIACPPEHGFERVANSLLGRVMGPVMRIVMSMHKPPQPATLDAATLSAGPFGTVVAALAGLPGAAIFRAALDGAFASAVLPRSVKALMFAVVARTLGCRISEAEARKLLAAEDFSNEEIDAALLTLRSPRLSQRDAQLLPWVRNTVYYQTAAVQKQTAALAAEIGEAALSRGGRRRRAGQRHGTVGDVAGMTESGLVWLLAALLALVVALGAGVLLLRRRARQLQRLLAVTQEKLEQLQLQFEHFVPADVVEQLTGAQGDYAPQRRTVTMLFADLRGFTALCDRLDPAVTVGILNEYFRRMSAVITAHHGHINELVGDGLLALFGALEHNPWQGRDAVLAALDMRAALASYNEELRAKSLPELRFGIGIHGGEVVAGIMGAGSLNKFTVTGDPINVASRVEGLTSVQKVDLLITEEIRRTLDDEFMLRRCHPCRSRASRSRS